MLTSGTDGDKVASVKEVIESYGNKNKEGSLYYAGTNGTDTHGQNGLVLNDVYEEHDEDGKIKDRTTVYDTLISDYVKLLNRKSDSLIDAAYCQYIIDTFSKAPDATENTAEARASVEAEISALQTRLDDLYQVLLVTMEEYNEYMGAVNVGVLSTTAVSARVNVKLYMMLGVVVFFILGVCGAILLGRIQDFVEYLFFTEQSLEMPNRTACDLYIKNNTERVLGDDNVCVVLELTNLSHINNELGRVKGNEVLRRFADFIKEGVKTTTNNGILFIFSVIYFGVMSDTGMFDVIVNFLVKKAGNNVIAVTVATAIIATIAHLDGTTATTGSDHDPSTVSCIQGNEDRHKDLTVPDWCMYGRYEPASLGRSGSACSNCSFYGC